MAMLVWGLGSCPWSCLEVPWGCRLSSHRPSSLTGSLFVWAHWEAPVGWWGTPGPPVRWHSLGRLCVARSCAR